MATIYWFNTILLLTNTKTVDEFIKLQLIDTNNFNTESLRRFLYLKQKGEVLGSSRWISILHNVLPTLPLVLEHPIWDILNSEAEDNAELNIDLLFRRIAMPEKALRLKYSSNAFVGTLEIKNRYFVTNASLEDHTLDRLVWLCLSYQKSRIENLKNSSNYIIEADIVNLFLFLAMESPIKYFWRIAYIKLFKFIHSNVKSNTFADRLIDKDSRTSNLLATPTNEYLDDLQREFNLIDKQLINK
jgi:hypothetical protein